MNYYKDLQRIDIGHAINQMAELVLPRGTNNKILLVNILFEMEDFRTRKERIPRLMREETFVYHRPDNYMFVGLMKSGTINSNDNYEMEFLSCHDSCWRDAVERKVSDIASEISRKYDDEEGLTVYTAFGVLGVRIVMGSIQINKSKKTAIFNRIQPIKLN